MSTPSSRMTKEQLKAALIVHGVPVPPGSAKKDEFLRLYKERVLPIQSRSEFSSDDEATEPDLVNGSVVELTSLKTMASIRSLSDEELFSACVQAFGRARVGPVLDNTRSVYQNKLLHHCAGTEASSPSHNAGSSSFTTAPTAEVNGNGANNFSDSDDDDETASMASRSSRTSGTSTTGVVNGRPGRTVQSRGKKIKKSTRDAEATSPTEPTLRGRGAQARRAADVPSVMVPTGRRTVLGRQLDDDESARPASFPDIIPPRSAVFRGRDFAAALQMERTFISSTRLPTPGPTPEVVDDKLEEDNVDEAVPEPAERIPRYMKFLGCLAILIAIVMASLFFKDSLVSLFNTKDNGEGDELDKYLESLTEGDSV